MLPIAGGPSENTPTTGGGGGDDGTTWEVLTPGADSTAVVTTTPGTTTATPGTTTTTTAGLITYHLLTLFHLFKPHLSCFNLFTTTDATTLIAASKPRV